MLIKQVAGLKGTIRVPGDKSISHRAVLFGSIAEGETEINGFLTGEDCISTIRCMRQLGVHIELDESSLSVLVKGRGWKGLMEPLSPLDVGNSGTTIRLLTGILSSLPFYTVIYGDDSIARRPMKRVVDPLRSMGARIVGREDGRYTPLAIQGTALTGTNYSSPIASAQVKSAILLAGLQASGQTTFTEPYHSRDHTERMLRYFDASIQHDGHTTTVKGGVTLRSKPVKIPGDVSSAAFLIAAALITPQSILTIHDVGLNPTRAGFIDVLRQMGGNIQITNERYWGEELVADIIVTSSELYGTEINGDMIPRLIDEIPILAVVATQAEGRTVIKDASELRVKESDRIHTITSELQKFGGNVVEKEDGLIIQGKTKLVGASSNSYGDHRIAMSMAIAGLVAEGDTLIKDEAAINVSFPGFHHLLKSVTLMDIQN